MPGALASAVSAPLGGRWATRSGPRPSVAAAPRCSPPRWPGCSRPARRPQFFGVWLPYGIVAGVGIGLGLPTLIGATASGLPPARFATGMALATTARQLGAVLGVALLVAVIGTPAPGDAMAAFDAGFALCAIAVTLAAVLGAAARARARRRRGRRSQRRMRRAPLLTCCSPANGRPTREHEVESAWSGCVQPASRRTSMRCVPHPNAGL